MLNGDDGLFETAFGWTQLAFITCPFCYGVGERTIESGGPKIYTCEPCRGTGLLHPKSAQKFKENIRRAKNANA